MCYNGITDKGGNTVKIGTIGYNYRHDMRTENFDLDRPAGPGAPLMLLIKTPSRFWIKGEEFTVKANSFVLFNSDTPCRYTGEGDCYTDDWIYFDMTAEDFEYLEKLGIPTDTVVHIGSLDELSQLVHILAFEHYSANSFHDEIEQQYIKILILKLARAIGLKNHASSKLLSEKNYRMTQLRSEIYTFPERMGDVDEMAKSLGMSRSGFQHLYRKMFGTSVINDVIAGRIQQAQRLLSSTNLTVKEIAARCGYSNAYSFMRQFKQRCGKTPTEYRSNM